MFVQPFVLAASLAASVVPAPDGGPVVLTAGDDLSVTFPAERSTQMAAVAVDFAANPIPAGYLAGPGLSSDAFTGKVQFRGLPLETVPPGALGQTNMIVRRPADTPGLAVGGLTIVPAHVAALRLETVEPVTITFNGGTVQEQFLLELTLSRTTPQPIGSALIVRTDADGGTISYNFPLVAALDFTQVGAGPVGTLDPYGPFQLETDETPWLMQGGPGGFDPAAHGAPAPPPMVQFDGDADGVMDHTTLADSNLEVGFSWDVLGSIEGEPLYFSTSADEFETTQKAGEDPDGDGWTGIYDNCPDVWNRRQRDSDGDGIGDACDDTPHGEDGDTYISEESVANTGSDTLEFVELIGPPGASLDGHVFLIVNGQDGNNLGHLDQVIDLSGQVIPADGYFVFGDQAVSNVDYVLPNFTLPNGTRTYYLVTAANPPDFLQYLGLDVDFDDDRRTVLPGIATEVLDVLALWDGDTFDRVYDGAWRTTMGPRTPNGLVPAGVFRGGCSTVLRTAWCADAFLDPDAQSNLDQPRTPGGPNALCPGTDLGGASFCSGDGSAADCPCQNFVQGDSGCANSSNQGGLLLASGAAEISSDTLVLTAVGVLPGQPGLFFEGQQAINHGLGIVLGDGLLCAGPPIRRLQVVFPDAGGVASSTVTITSLSTVAAGETRAYQFWYRDNSGSPCGNNFNLTQGLLVPWAP